MIHQLTPNFSLEELLRSEKATQLGYAEQFEPPVVVVESLTVLCKKLLQPIRDLYGKPLLVSSGWRCFRTNKAVKGKSNSQHLTGEAADLDFGSREENKRLFEKIVAWQKAGLIEFDQCLNEYDFAWIHVSYKRIGKNRNQVLNITT